MKACDGWTIIKYERENDTHETNSGLILPSARNRRVMLKGKTHVISSDPEGNLPDYIRTGVIVSSNKYKEGTQVLFNKHDGFGFELDKDYLFTIKDELIMAYF